jgi:hypothetical protein
MIIEITLSLIGETISSLTRIRLNNERQGGESKLHKFRNESKLE